MSISASLVKELRERTGAGMMECKKALVAADGDIDAAFDQLRKSGAAKAAKKSGRVAADGAIVTAASDDGSTAVLAEVNSETDFVAKDETFQAFARAIAATVLEAQPADPAALSECRLSGSDDTVESQRTQLVAKVGENISVRRFTTVTNAGGKVASYLHGNRIGVLVCLSGGDEALARDIAMHIAASRPVCVAEADIPPELLAKEKEILSAQAAESGKPPEIVEKMVKGRIGKFVNEVTLLGQPFVKDPDTTVGKLLKGAGAEVTAFTRYEVGEGIEKESDNFADEVMATARAAGTGA